MLWRSFSSHLKGTNTGKAAKSQLIGKKLEKWLYARLNITASTPQRIEISHIYDKIEIDK
eukprot:m.14845 g.14845  ORF g.14845 m.14845 type:complete len:60 (-) comp5223_c0_seq1:26-205(-)